MQRLVLTLRRAEEYGPDKEIRSIAVDLPIDAEERDLRSAYQHVDLVLMGEARKHMDAAAELVAGIIEAHAELSERKEEHPLTTARSMDEQRAERAVEQAADSSPTMDEIADSVKASTPGRPS